MVSKVPKFGAWEAQGGENYTVYFDNARKKKTNGKMINPNDPQENPDMFPQNNGGAANQKGQPSKVPEFGAWENGDNVGYTAYFENKRKSKNGQPTSVPNEPQMNRDIQPQPQPQTQNQTQNQTAKVEPQQQARSKVPPFGGWEVGEGDAGYTQSFDNVRKNNKNGRTVTPEPPSEAPNKEGRAKVPQFGAWEEGDSNGGGYTAYFENAAKNKNAKPVIDPVPVEPQLNRDVINRTRPSAAAGTKNKADDHHLRNGSRGSNASVGTSDSGNRHGKQNPGGQSPIHQKAGAKLQPKHPNRGSHTVSTYQLGKIGKNSPNYGRSSKNSLNY
ncbi:RPM1-interacting protein 4 [Bienertia sinuspersici]